MTVNRFYQEAGYLCITNYTINMDHPIGDTERFCQYFADSFNGSTFIRLTMARPASKKDPLSNIYFRPVHLKGKLMISVIFRYTTRDDTRNFSLTEALDLLREKLGSHFLNANLFTSNGDFQLLFSKRRKTTLLHQKPALLSPVTMEHDKPKRRFIRFEGNIYLEKLGIVTKEGRIVTGMNDKYRQIEKYIGIIDNIIQKKNKTLPFSVVDMGSGKGYLTFTLYDHLVNNLGLNVGITGVEQRQELVDLCNRIATEVGFGNLKFVQGSISGFDDQKIDMLIALHACDTATDDAIYKGIRAGAAYIICAPCCHKQIRKQMKPGKDFVPVLKHGIFLERQAEMITDGLRALLLEKNGYSTKVFEFIPVDHTPKNVMIVATKSHRSADVPKISKQINQIKELFGIRYHHLEKLIDSEPVDE